MTGGLFEFSSRLISNPGGYGKREGLNIREYSNTCAECSSNIK